MVSNLLSGIMVSGGDFIKPGDVISIYSWLFGQTITGRVEDVKVLHTGIRNSMEQIIMLQNTTLLCRVWKLGIPLRLAILRYSSWFVRNILADL